MNRFFEIIKYTWKAKGRHGIHSPFVYDLVNTCFNLPVSKKLLATIAAELGTSTSSLKLLSQLTKHLNFNYIWTNLEKKDVLHSFLQQQHILSEIHHLDQFKQTTNELSVDLIYIDCADLPYSICEKVIELIPALNDHSLLVLIGIRTNTHTFLQWNELVSHSNLHFTADMYQFGLLSKRSFQEKEHFVLRY